MPTEQVFSPGGHSVVNSLRIAGTNVEDLDPIRIRLAETQGPYVSQAARVVLVQNAWTMLTWREYVSQVRDYPLETKLRHLVRTAAARSVVSRANSTVALTDYMAHLVRDKGLALPQVYSVGTSIDLFELPEQKPNVEIGGHFALVPGSIQPYKRPLDAVRILGQHRSLLPQLDQVVFAGPIIDKALREELTREARAISLEPVFLGLTRPEMKWALSNSEVTILSSGLESLNFGLGEALYLSNLVVASPIPVHIEVASRLAADPVWITDQLDTTSFRSARQPRESLYEVWHKLGALLRGQS